MYERVSILNLVDLAGSERINEFDLNPGINGETGYINKSLFVLSNVISKLSENKKLFNLEDIFRTEIQN